LVTLSPSCRWTRFKVSGINEYFINLGDRGEKCPLPKHLYNGAGECISPPIQDIHVRSLRTKSQQGLIPRLLDFGVTNATKNGEIADDKKKSSEDKKTKQETVLSPTQLLLQYIKDLMVEAGKNGHGKISSRTARKINRFIMSSVADAAKELLQSALLKYSLPAQEDTMEETKGSTLVTPDRPLSLSEGGVVVSPMTCFMATILPQQELLLRLALLLL
jgi:hypothetical protein